MTATERAKRSDALYYATESVNRRVLCDMIANREADLEDARAENDELWASNERMGLKAMAAIGEVQEENERLQADNAKLRELVRDMLHDAMENICSKAYWCGEKNWQTCNDEECGNRLYVEMASELGVDE